MKPRYFENNTGHFCIEHDKGNVRLTFGNNERERVIFLNQRNAIVLGQAIIDAANALAEDGKESV